MRELKILVVDDERGLRETLKIYFRRQDIYCDTCASVFEALKRIEEETFDIYILDLRLPDGDGIQILKRIKEINPAGVVIMLTAYGTIEIAVEAMKLGAYDFISKPFKMKKFDELMGKVFTEVEFIKRSKTQEEEYGYQGIIGVSYPMKELFRTISQVAPSDIPVLIIGESGTGRSLVARVIHQVSDRRSYPFVVVSPGAIPEESIEKELLGLSGEVGILERADKGSLYLDELTDMSARFQRTINRFLEEKRVGIGTEREKEVDIRVISSGMDLTKMRENGDFRQDLYFRLKGVEIYLPPLRERKEDIPYLLTHFIKEASERYEKKIEGCSASFVELLMNYPFPGNVRELKSLVERCVVLATEEKLKESLLPEEIKYWDPSQPKSLDDYLEEIEREKIVEALKKAGGVKTKAAEILGISFRSLRYRVKKIVE